jgi:hypothetical protein
VTMKSVIFWDVMLCSAAEVVTVSAVFFMLGDCLAYSLTLRTEAGHSSEMSVNFYHTTRCHIPQDGLIVHPVPDSRTLQTSSAANTSCKYLIRQSLHENCSLCPWQMPSYGAQINYFQCIVMRDLPAAFLAVSAATFSIASPSALAQSWGQTSPGQPHSCMPPTGIANCHSLPENKVR